MENLLHIGKPSGLTCPDCSGALFELEDARPVRFRCHVLLRRLAAVSRQTRQAAEAEAGEKRAEELRQHAVTLTRLIEEDDVRSA